MWPFRFAARNKRGLPHVVVFLLSKSPQNGVELMDGVESLTRGWWRPTPGSIYPLLKEMSEQGVVRRRDDGRYELTEKGRGQLGGSPGPRPIWPRDTGDMIAQMNNFVSYMEHLKESGSPEVDSHAGALRELRLKLSKLLGDAASQG